MEKVELLAPAGSLAKLKYALVYGADAVYIGGEEFSLRVAAKNFTADEIKEGIDFAHNLGKKVYITANIIPHNGDIKKFPEFVREVDALGADAIIISDPGMFALAKKCAPRLDIHISTQANNTNFESAKFWHSQGAKRVILAREMSFDEIREIRENTPSDLELECFVHGAMCISYSGRCLLSNYMTHRDANMGACAHPCRWKYALVEEKRPGEYMPVFENERGTFIYNSKDLCMIERIPEIIESGITSLKIEGRVKNELYVATVVKAYRREIDAYYKDKKNYKFNPENLEELKKISYRGYTTGFFDEKPKGTEQVYTSSTYIQNYQTTAVVKAFDKQTKTVTLEQRNRFFVGDEIEFLMPNGENRSFKITEMTDADGNSIDVAPHPQMIVKFKVDFDVEDYSIVRTKVDVKNLNDR
ncbi:peptidase U32 family protein [Qingrenia yutianensis]|uniref:U32 family peptidase C-terminal domain-containing protein n=1 Tax=Qingrenia yutianensis TaxID=2763676 RepID=A0A926FDH8_9FIRM|nr:U32 family peptidase C-terminal domain-containing protein [Qingrenia yutianensis]MBC8596275.1 U32 family peptidase C-terminal domain-containing protein [Qingrenia yutianensis]